MLLVKINALYDTSGHVQLMLSGASHDSKTQIHIMKGSCLLICSFKGDGSSESQKVDCVIYLSFACGAQSI